MVASKGEGGKEEDGDLGCSYFLGARPLSQKVLPHHRTVVWDVARSLS